MDISKVDPRAMQALRRQRLACLLGGIAVGKLMAEGIDALTRYENVSEVQYDVRPHEEDGNMVMVKARARIRSSEQKFEQAVCLSVEQIARNGAVEAPYERPIDELFAKLSVVMGELKGRVAKGHE